MKTVNKTLRISRVSPAGVNQWEKLEIGRILSAGGYYVVKTDKGYARVANAGDADAIEVPYMGYEAESAADLAELLPAVYDKATTTWEMDTESALKAANSNADLVLNKAVRDFYSTESIGGRGAAAKFNAASGWLVANAGKRLVEIFTEAERIETEQGIDAKREYVLRVYQELKSGK